MPALVQAGKVVSGYSGEGRGGWATLVGISHTK